MRLLGFGLLAFVLGLVAGWVAAAAIGLVYMDVAGVFDRDGGLSMSLIFGIGPLAGILCGAIAAVATIIRMRRNKTGQAGSTAARSGPPSAARLATATIIGALVGYFGTGGIMWLLGPLAFESYYVALAVSYVPVAAAIVCALCGWRLAKGRARAASG